MDLTALVNDTLKSFDAKTDHINESTDLPAGKYLTILDAVEHRVFKSGYDCIQITMKVISGKYASRQEFIRISMATMTKSGKEMPEFVLSRNIKTIAQLGAMVGLQITSDIFAHDNETDIHEAVAQAFQPYLAKQVGMTIRVTPNKKDPDNSYRNYEFSQIKPANPAATDTPSDEELPF